MKAQKTPATAVANVRVKSPREARRRVSIEMEGPTLTKQSFKEECDINNVLARYKESGRLPDLIKSNPQYGDFSEPLDYQEALNTVLRAEEQFSLLPSKIRERFANDPKQFLEFTSNPENGEEMVKLGLAVKQQRSNDDEKTASPEANPKSPTPNKVNQDAQEI